MSAPLLELRDLVVEFATADGPLRAVDGVSLSLDRGGTLGVVGESGSGKSVTFLALMGLLDPGSARVAGHAGFDGHDLLSPDRGALRALRGSRIGMVFQDPMTALHPMHRIGDQIAEGLRAHRRADRAGAAAGAVAALRAVGISSPERRARQYPHELSGGMRQRAMIAMALALEPDLLIADEPTTALDVTVQAQILDLIAEVQERIGLALIIISHDLGVIAEVAREVVVMYAGRVVEAGPGPSVFAAPAHPYTWGLLDSIPRAGASSDRLTPIPGAPPSPGRRPPGCAFHPRCAHRFAPCEEELPAPGGDEHRSWCHLAPDVRRRLGEERRVRRLGVPG